MAPLLRTSAVACGVGSRWLRQPVLTPLRFIATTPFLRGSLSDPLSTLFISGAARACNPPQPPSSRLEEEGPSSSSFSSRSEASAKAILWRAISRCAPS